MLLISLNGHLTYTKRKAVKATNNILTDSLDGKVEKVWVEDA